MKRCKKLLCLVLALVMALSLCTVAMADDPVESGAGTITVTGINFTLAESLYGYAKPVSGVNGVSGTTNAVVYTDGTSTHESQFLNSFITTLGIADKYVFELNEGGTGYTATYDGYFCADKQYYVGVSFEKQTRQSEDVYDFSWKNNMTAADFTLNGWKAESVGFSMPSTDAAGTVYFKLPKLDAVPLQIPFTAITERGGNVTPGVGTFTLKVANAAVGSNTPIDNNGFTFDGLTYTTNGVDEAEKYFTIQNNDYGKILQLLQEGLVVTQDGNVGAGWSHDNTMWCVMLDDAPELNALSTDDVGIPSDLVFGFYTGSMGEDEFEADSNVSAAKMSFKNIYTENVVVDDPVVDEPINRQTVTPAPEAPATKPVASPKTGDMGVALYAAMALLSMSGSAVIIGKKRSK